MEKEVVDIFVDGSIRKNGKPDAFGGVGVVAFKNDKIVLKFSQLVKSATNNESEYAAVFAGVKVGNELKRDFVIHSDSELIVRQIKGEYEVTKPSLINWYNKVVFNMEVSPYYKGIEWISREYNKEADKLAQSITKEAL
jgi:ribonuclease HI